MSMLVPSFRTLRNPCGKNIHLQESFNPGDFHVQCGRTGKQSFNSTGNRRFRLLVNKYTESYGLARTKLDKSLVVVCIIDAIRSHGGGFVKQDKKTKRWIEIGDQLARDKVGHCLRDAIAVNSRQQHSKVDDLTVEDIMRLSREELISLENDKKSTRKFSFAVTTRPSPTPSSGAQIVNGSKRGLYSPASNQMSTETSSSPQSVQARSSISGAVPSTIISIDPIVEHNLITDEYFESEESYDNLCRPGADCAFYRPFHSIEVDENSLFSAFEDEIASACTVTSQGSAVPVSDDDDSQIDVIADQVLESRFTTYLDKLVF